jgi:hypothetical protein
MGRDRLGVSIGAVFHEVRHAYQERNLENLRNEEEPHLAWLGALTAPQLESWQQGAASYVARSAEGSVDYHLNALEQDARHAESALIAGFYRSRWEHLTNPDLLAGHFGSDN